MISIFTSTINREFYLKKQIESILQLSDFHRWEFEHIILFQGVKPSNEIQEYINGLPYSPRVEYWPEIKVDGYVMNWAKDQLRYPIFMKLDDDAILRSPNYFSHVIELSKLIPDSVFSPYPVGLINNPGGVLSNDRRVIYSKEMDTFYTLRGVPHIGGFARIAPSKFIQQINYSNGRHEDTETSNWCKSIGIPLFYLENSLIVEHAESTLGQHERYKEYFNERF